MKPVSMADRRAMSSFAALFNVLRENPSEAARLILLHSQCPTPYPGHYAAIHLLGIMIGLACAMENQKLGISLIDLLEQVKENHKDLLQLKPSDYIGETRKWARGGGM